MGHRASAEGSDRNPFAALEDDSSEEETESKPARTKQKGETSKRTERSDSPRKRSKLVGSTTPKVLRAPRTYFDSPVSVLTYNVLAEHLCKPAWFPYRSKSELDWRVRREHVKAKIVDADCGIICLQEVQVFHGPEHLRGNEHHAEWFDHWLRHERKYTGTVGSRLNASGKQQPGVQIGNMLYWKEELFEPLLIQQCVPLLKTISTALSGDKDLRRVYCHSGVRGTVATMVALQCRVSGRVIVVATTHLPAPRHDDDNGSKLEQFMHACALLHEISAFARRVKKGVDAIMLCGDLNSTPDNEVCQLLESGGLSRSKVDQIIRKGGQIRAPFTEPTGRLLIPSFPLAARYSASEDQTVDDGAFFKNVLKTGMNGASIGFTNHTDKFTGWLDHVFVMETPGAIKSILTSDPSAAIDSTRFLPDPEFGHGSDHLPVKCELVMAQQDAGRDHEDPVIVEKVAKGPRGSVGEESGEVEEDAPTNRVRYRLVATEADEDLAVRELVSHAKESSALIMDFQGTNVSRLGRVGLAVLKLIDLAESDDDKDDGQVIVLDAIALNWKVRGIPEGLSHLLADSTLLKIGFDLRRDSDALQHLFSVRLSNALDLQILDQGLRLARGENLPERTQTWFPHLPRLNKVAMQYVPEESWSHLYMPSNWEKNELHVWTKRPVHPAVIEIAACQVEIMAILLRTIRSSQAIPSNILGKVELHCRRAVDDFRSREAPVHDDGDKKAVLEELSILEHYTTELPSNLSRWKEMNLIRTQE